MVKIVSLILFLVLVASSAALGADQPFSFALKGGIGLANMTTTYEEKPDPVNIMRPSGGFNLSSGVASHVGIDLDCLYVTKGSDEKIVTQGMPPDEINMKTQIHYVVLSPMLRLTPGTGSGGVYLLGGAEVGYMIDAKTDVRIVSASGEAYKDQYDMSSRLKDLDYGATVGLGFQTGSRDGSGLFLEGRYALGMTDIKNTQVSTVERIPDVKTRTVYLFGGVRF